MIKDILAKRWEVGAEHYALGSNGFNENQWLKIMENLLGIKGGDGNNKQALDVGTGPGVLAFVLVKLGYEVTGLDLSASMLSIAEKRKGELGVSCSFIKGDAEDLPFESNTFDLVTNRLNLWALPNPGKGVFHWVRVLKPGGKLVLIVNDRKHPFEELKKPKNNRHIFTDEYYNTFQHLPFSTATPSQVKALVEAAGLHHVFIQTFIDERSFSSTDIKHVLTANHIEEKEIEALNIDSGIVNEQQLKNILKRYNIREMEVQSNQGDIQLIMRKRMAAIIGQKEK